MTLGQLTVIVRAHWRVAATVFGVVVLVALLGTLLLPRKYTAMASLLVDAKLDPVNIGPGTATSDVQMASFVSTQTDIIASERVAQRVVTTLKLQDDPKLIQKWQSSTNGRGDIVDWLGKYLVSKSLTVAPAHESPTHASNVINIAVTWPDRETAARLANAFAQVAIETNIELKVEPAKQYTKWFEQRSRALRDELAIKQKRLSDYQTSAGIVATDEKLDVENARLQELSTQLITMQTLRQDSQSRQKQGRGDNGSIPEVLQSPVIGNLKDDLAQAQARQQEIAGRLGRNHPDYQAAKAEIAGLRDRIAEETQKIVASLGSTNQVNLRKEADVRVALEAQKKRVLELKHQHDQAAVFANEVTAAERDLDAVTQRYAQSNLESQAQQTNLIQLTTATEPIEPSSPRPLLNLLAGLFLGAAFGIGAAVFLESRNPLFRTNDDLVVILGVPTLGKIGSMLAPASVGGSGARHRLTRLKPSIT
jgi:chain length determinant protein EpsF